MTAYYNENDPKIAAWLKEMIADGIVAPGDVDERSIADVQGSDLKGYEQIHLFAGIAGWSCALRLAGWPDDRPVWTGSCPCQPFSSAGKQKAQDDSRHLWPEMSRLIRECKPDIIFGEQVASSEVVGTQLEAAFVVAVQAGDYAKANKLAKRLSQKRGFHYHPRWVDRVRADMEEDGYALEFHVLGAHSVGSPQIRQRVWWVADTERGAAKRHRRELAKTPCRVQGETQQREWVRDDIGDGGADGGLGHSQSRVGEIPIQQGRQEQACLEPRGAGGNCRLGDTDRGHCGEGNGAVEAGCSEANFWHGSSTIPCGDGKARRIEPGIAPLAYGIPARMVRLRGYGNAIVPQLAAQFIQAYREVVAQ